MYRDYEFSRNDTMLIQRPSGTWERVGVNFPALTYKDDTLGKYRAGQWIPKPLTNLFRNSEPTTGGTNVTFGSGNVGIVQADNHVIFGDNSVARTFYDTETIPIGTTLTGFFVVEPDDGQPFTIGISTSDLLSIRIGSNSTSPGQGTVTQIGDRTFIVSRTWTTAINSNQNGINKPTSCNAIGFKASCFMWVEGDYEGDLTLLDYIRTTGSSVARQPTDIRDPDFPMLANLQGYIDVEVDVSLASGFPQIMRYGAANNDSSRLILDSASNIEMGYAIGNVNQWTIEGNIGASGRKRLGYFFSNGLNILWLNGVEIGRNTNAWGPQGNIFVLGGLISGTGNKLTNGGYFGQFMATGESVEKLLTEMAFDDLPEWTAFVRAKFDDESLTTSAITLLQNTSL